MLSKDQVAGDVVLAEQGADYCRETKTVTNSGEAAITLPAGYPMDDNVPVMSGDEANTDGINLTPVTIPASGSAKVAVLARGPAIVNKTKLPATDLDGDSLTAATIATALAALDPPVVVRIEPAKQEPD